MCAAITGLDDVTGILLDHSFLDNFFLGALKEGEILHLYMSMITSKRWKISGWHLKRIVDLCHIKLLYIYILDLLLKISQNECWIETFSGRYNRDIQGQSFYSDGLCIHLSCYRLPVMPHVPHDNCSVILYLLLCYIVLLCVLLKVEEAIKDYT